MNYIAMQLLGSAKEGVLLYEVVLLILALRSHRELAVRLLSEAIQHVTSYAEFELLLEIAFALANDHGMTPLSCTSFPLC
jgi:hypothetical protein